MEQQSIFPEHQHPQNLPNATAVLVLGILSIVCLCCYGIPGLILSIIALVLAAKDQRMYLIDPAAYTLASHKNLKAGKTCAVISLVLFGVSMIAVIAFIATVGVAALQDQSWINHLH